MSTRPDSSSDRQAVLILPSTQEPPTDAVRAWLPQVLAHAPALPRLHSLLVAEELVCNAREHAEPPYVLRLALDAGGRSLRLFVDDWDPRPPAAWSSGAGLVLVAGLSRAWGVRRYGGVKTVWAEIDPRPGVPRLVHPSTSPPARGTDR